VGLEGREWAEKKDEGEGVVEGRERERRADSEGWCPLNKNSGDATGHRYSYFDIITCFKHDS
jgi:hypothetical protein